MTYQLSAIVSPHIFRAYDIRGNVIDELTPDTVYTIGLALGSESQQRGQSQFVIARDGRHSGPTLLEALQAGLCASGCDVLNLGAVPTPLLYFATKTLAATSGVMLTGSHNPPEYNGLKIVMAGNVFFGDDIQHIFSRIQSQQFLAGTGSATTHDIVPEYVKTLIADIKLSRKLKVVVDCGNGITGMLAPQLIEQLGCEVIPLFAEVDGDFPGHHPDPSIPENLVDVINAVEQHNADIGLAFDGDGDRLGVVTNRGEVIWPDRQMMLYAQDVLSHNPGATIIFDIKCSRHLEQVIEQSGGKPIMWRTGHSFIKTKMAEEKALLGGEMSGHVFFKDRWYGFDDGLYVAARLLEILSNQNQTSSEIFAKLPDSINTPEMKLSLADDKKFSFVEKFSRQAQFIDARLSTIDGLRVDFEDGWGLVRPSNTTPCIVFRFEADSEQSLANVQARFKEQLLAADPELELPF